VSSFRRKVALQVRRESYAVLVHAGAHCDAIDRSSAIRSRLIDHNDG